MKRNAHLYLQVHRFLKQDTQRKKLRFFHSNIRAQNQTPQFKIKLSMKQQPSQLGNDDFNSYCIFPFSGQSTGGLMWHITVIYLNDTGLIGSSLTSSIRPSGFIMYCTTRVHVLVLYLFLCFI